MSVLSSNVSGCFRKSRHPAATVADHLAEKTAKAVPWMVSNGDVGGEVADEAGAVATVVELAVFVGVERLVEKADPVEDLAAVGDPDALRRYLLRFVAVDEGFRMMAQPGVPRRRHRALQRAWRL